MSEKGLKLLVYDAYRPTSAVTDFIKWAEDLSDTATKEAYYPDLEKEKILRDGYVAPKVVAQPGKHGGSDARGQYFGSFRWTWVVPSITSVRSQTPTTRT